MVQNETNENASLTKEELEKRREEITAFYKTNIEHLKVQKEYEELLRDIEKARVEKIQAQMILAQMYTEENSDEKSEAAKDFTKEKLNNKLKIK